MKIHPMGRVILQDAINGATSDKRGSCYQDDMVTLVVNDDESITVRKFELADLGDEREQMLWLHREVLLEECAVKMPLFTTHLPEKYPDGTGYGWQFLAGVLHRNGVPEDMSRDMLANMLDEGLIVALGMFKNACGPDFMMFAAVNKEDS